MAEEKKNEELEKGFTIRDKRFSARREEDKEIKGEIPKEETPQKEETPLPEINFINFIFSLSTSALIQLGEVQDPITQKQSKNLPLAKQTIDLIGMLKEKTKGNLSSEEEKFIDNVLFDLRMRYVKAVG
ncbi:MAG: DUF1844 domain-containing protein [Thermodesulfobacteriota bacterium]